MDKTRFVVRVGVTFDADSYEEAGEILDYIDRKVAKALRERGHHEITGFETRPCSAARFDRAVEGPDAYEARAMMTVDDRAEHPHPRRT